MLRCQFQRHVLKALFFIKIALKLSYFCKKMQNFRALGAPPPHPRASGGWWLCPQTPTGLLRVPPPDPRNSPPIANVCLRACPHIADFWLCSCFVITFCLSFSCVFIERRLSRRVFSFYKFANLEKCQQSSTSAFSSNGSVHRMFPGDLQLRQCGGAVL